MYCKYLACNVKVSYEGLYCYSDDDVHLAGASKGSLGFLAPLNASLLIQRLKISAINYIASPAIFYWSTGLLGIKNGISTSIILEFIAGSARLLGARITGPGDSLPETVHVERHRTCLRMNLRQGYKFSTPGNPRNREDYGVCYITISHAQRKDFIHGASRNASVVAHRAQRASRSQRRSPTYVQCVSCKPELCTCNTFHHCASRSGCLRRRWWQRARGCQ